MELSQEQPDNGVFWFNLGNSYFMLSDFANAVSSYQKVVELKSKLAIAAQLYIAKSLYKNNQLHEAQKVVSEIEVSKAPVHIKAQAEELKLEIQALIEENYDLKLQAEALSQYRAGDYKKSLETIRSLKKQNLESYSFATLIYIKLEKLKQAEAMLKKTEELVQTDEEKSDFQELRTLVLELKSKLSEFDLSTELNYGYNTNIYGAAHLDNPETSDQAYVYALFYWQNRLGRGWLWPVSYTVNYSAIMKD